jgi:formylglycine-generating enzyme required for sulfatase activity
MAMTVLIIHASDSFKNPNDLVAGVGGVAAPSTRCPSDMVFVSSPNGGFCIDKYENSPGKSCPHSDPKNQFETNDNMSQPLCVSVSVPESDPWVNIPVTQAMEICTRGGKHLASNGEWYRAALGTPDTVNTEIGSPNCVLGRIGVSHGEKTGSHSACVSSVGAFDMVGNVWEWVDGNIVNGVYEKRDLPREGFITETDVDGVPVSVASSSSEVFHGDYFYIKRDGVSGMLRGGFWNLSEKAGVTTVNATIPTTFVGSAVGFRCAK